MPNNFPTTAVAAIANAPQKVTRSDPFAIGAPPVRAASAPKIATVDSTGMVTGVAVGDAAIAVNIDGATDTAYVRIVSVSVAAISIQAPSKQVTLLVHEMRTFAAVASDSS